MGEDLLDDGGFEPVMLPELTRRTQTTPLPLPVQNPALLPLPSLDADVLERLAAEIVSRRDNLTAQFYGRRGQKQYGLDIVERERAERRTLYQVKRYSTLVKGQLRAAVEEYAGPPRSSAYSGKPRRFDPQRFVVVTSAAAESDVGVVDELAALQDEYAGDLEIDAWGAEELSRKLRDMSRLVYAVFGPHWAESFCGFVPRLGEVPTPKALGFVEDPVAVLNLDALRADAEAAESDGGQSNAARLFGVVAEGLGDGGFPGHSAWMRWRQAKALRKAGEPDAAFGIFFRLALDQVLAGWSGEVRSLLHELESLTADVDGARQAQHQVLEATVSWYTGGSQLAVAVSALRTLAQSGDPHASLLTCLVLEQAIVDGLYDWQPLHTDLFEIDAAAEADLRELRELGAADCSDPVIRARLRCAVADASLTLNSSVADVEAAYRLLNEDALAGRLHHGRGLVAARAARAFAMAGDRERAENLQRQAIIASTEHAYFGDTRSMIRAGVRLDADSSILRFLGPGGELNFLPNQRRLLAGAFEPALSTLRAAHDGELASALGDARRYLWESRLSGHLAEEAHALRLVGDVLAAAGHPVEAVAFYIQAGAPDKAAELAGGFESPIDVSRWTEVRLRRCQAAAIQVIGAQAAVTTDTDVPRVIDGLLKIAEGVWSSPWNSPRPERDALEAIARFGSRIPPAAIDRIIALAGPARNNATRLSEPIANLLVQSYWAVEQRHGDLAAVICDLLRVTDGSDGLWSLLAAVPATARGPLLPTVTEYADQHLEQAIECLAAWHIAIPTVQRRARQACAAMFRQPVGVERTSWQVSSTRWSTTAQLVLALATAEELVNVGVDELNPEHTRLADGVFGTFTYVAGPNADARATNAVLNLLPSGVPGEPDHAAMTAAGEPAQLLAAVAQHLAAMVADRTEAAAERVAAAHALRQLIGHLPADTADALVPDLIAVNRDPGYSQADLFEIRSTSSLSSVKVNSGAIRLPAMALLAAAELSAAARTAADGVTERAADERATGEIAAAAIPLLHHPDEECRLIGAVAVTALAGAVPELSERAIGLLYHPDVRVRAHGAALAPLSPHTITMLANDPSSLVRSALAYRGAELPDSVRARLASDVHALVRRNVNLPKAP